jgi:ABC-2 type transport system permease protein
MTDLVAAEWLKLRTTRLLHGMIPAAALISFAAVAGSVLAADRAGIALESTRGIRRVLPITGTGAIVVLIVGILVSAGEYRHGTAPDTFLTTPRRHQVVAAKLVVGAVIGLAVGLITSLACVGIAALLYNVKGAAFPFDHTEVWLTLAGTLVYTTLFAVLGVALGTLVRNQVLAVAGALAWIAIVEHILVNLAPDVGRWLPAAAGQAIIRTPLDGLLSPLGGAALLAAYAAAIAMAGIRFAATRDA